MEKKIISRSEAHKLGLKRYFTGEPCKQGHISERKTISYSCLACQKDWTLNNKETVSAIRKEYLEKNKERVSEKNKEYRAKNRDAINERTKARRLKDLEKSRARERSWKEKNPNYSREYHAANRDRVIARKRVYYSERKAQISIEVKESRKSNPAYWKAKGKKTYEDNKDKWLAWGSKRRAARRQAVPQWFGEFDQLVFDEAYDIASRREIATGLKWHVDHMIPLRAKKACGLHVWQNVQVIPEFLNLSKSNKMIFIDRCEWIKAT